MAKDKNLPEEKSDRQEDVFLREVDDAVREDNLKDMARRYGIWIALLIVASLAALAGWIFYQNHKGEKSGIRSEEYIAAVDSLKANNLDGASAALKKLETADQKGYQAAAKMMQANISLEKNNPKKAAQGYANVVADKNLPQAFRDLALVRQTATEFDSLKPQQVIDRLKPLAVPGSPWFGSAGEMVAVSYLNMGKDNLAGPLFAQLAKDKSVPPTIRSRALQMAGVQGIDAVELNDDAARTPAVGTSPDAAQSGEE